MLTLAVLAGGKGTRLRSIISDVPKPMAPINGKPFLHCILDYWFTILEPDQVVLSTGYLKKVIRDYFGDTFETRVPIIYSEEFTPLGTGGALVKLSSYVQSGGLILINGDTIFAPSNKLDFLNHRVGSNLRILSKRLPSADRYSSLLTNDAGEILSIGKSEADWQLINGGAYHFSSELVEKMRNFKKVIPLSLEDELLPHLIKDPTVEVLSVESSSPFLDIGIPSDFIKAQTVLAKLKEV